MLFTKNFGASFFILAHLINFIEFIHAFSHGAPNSACSSMFPGHGVDEQSFSSNTYEIVVSSTDGRKVSIEIRGVKGFRGFILQARDSSDNSAIINGDFTESPSAQTLNCLHSSKNTLTHRDGTDKYSVSTTWTPHSSFSGAIVFRATIVFTKSIFWTAVESSPIEISKFSSSPYARQISTTGYPQSTYSSPYSPARVTNFFQGTTEAIKTTIYSTCGKSRTCFGIEEDCLSSESCSLLLLGNQHGVNEVDFEIVGKKTNNDNRYFAVGFSFDKTMGEDLVVECIVNENNQGHLRESWNEAGRKSNRLLPLSAENSFLKNVQIQYIDGYIRCKWRQYLNVTINGKTFDTRQVYTLIAHGQTDEAGEKRYHDARVASPSILDYSKYTRVSSESTVDILIRFHGSLMVITWLALVSIAMLIARHYKPVWPETMVFGKQLWFVLHQGTMIIAIILAIVSQICIFTYVQGWRADTLHQYFGAAAFLLMLTQPIVALFRCTPAHDKRWIFNWWHWLVGNTAHIFAITAIFLAFNFKQLSLHSAFIWILVAFVVCHCFVQLILQIQLWCSNDRNRVSDSIAMTDMKSHPTIVTENSNTFKQVLLGFYVVIVSFLSLILVLLICFPSKS